MKHEDPGLASWLQLTLTPGLGASAVRDLLRAHGLPQHFLTAQRAQLARALAPAVLEALQSEAVMRAVEHARAWARAPRHAVVTLADATYPKLLLEIGDPPPLLYADGRLELLEQPALAVVGSRNATAQGSRNAQTFGKAFSDAGLTIVSGLALGIDAAAHRGGLAGRGSTIAVLGTGIDVRYPPANAALAAEIAQHGLLVSEFPLGTPAAAQNFPRRNRLISGLARGCLVIEAALGSGSLITARAAADQGREVFAVPGSIHSPLAKGCHALIKQGAKLVESAEDVMSELGVALAGTARVPVSAQAPAADETALLAHMGFEPVNVDTLCGRSGLTAEQICAELLQLELAGRVAPLPGGLYQRLD